MKTSELNRVLTIQKDLSSYRASLAVKDSGVIVISNKNDKVVSQLKNIEQLEAWYEGFKAHSNITNPYQGSQMR